MAHDLGLVADYLARWSWHRAGGATGTVAAGTFDPRIDALRRIVVRRLAGDAVLARLESEATEDLETGPRISARTRQRVQLAIEEAAEEDATFAAQLHDLLAQLAEVREQMPDGRGVVAGRDAVAHAESGGVAVLNLNGPMTMHRSVPEGGRAMAGGSTPRATGVSVGTGDAVVASHGGLAVGRLSYERRNGVLYATRLEPRPRRVVGREQMITSVRHRLAGSDNRRPAVVALAGLGGVGKTTVALEYAHRFVGEYRVVWHFHAEDATDLLAQFGELARLLDPDDLLDRGDPVGRVHAALASLDGPWLLLIDNVRDAGAARRWLPAKGRGHVVVTTQDGLWPHGERFDVGVLDVETAAGFLLDRAGEADVASARAVATELGLLPLALAQAAGYVETTGRSLEQYLTLLRGNRAQVLARGAPAGHAEPVVLTWALALTELADSSPWSLVLLRLLSCLAPEEIPFRLLLSGDGRLPSTLETEVAAQVAGLRAEVFALDDAVAGLRRHSLIGPPTERVSVHRLVQATTLDQCEDRQRDTWRSAARAVVEAAIPKDTTARAAWPVCAALLPHARVVLNPLSDGMRRLAEHLTHRGDHASAVTLWKELAAAHRAALGNDHPDTLMARTSLANATGQAGDPSAARDQFAEVLAVRERVLGREHPSTLTARTNLAHWTAVAGDPASARDQFARLLPLQEKVMGSDHRDTLTTRNNLALSAGQAGNADEARDLLARLLKVQRRVLGAEDADTLTTRYNLAHWTGQAGDPAAARDQFAQLLPAQEGVLGPEHPDTLATRHNLAHWTGEAGDAAAARDLFAQLVPLQERVLGPEHPDTVIARDCLTRWTRAASRGRTAK